MEFNKKFLVSPMTLSPYVRTDLLVTSFLTFVFWILVKNFVDWILRNLIKVYRFLIMEMGILSAL